MTPGARLAAAIDILDGIERGEPAEKVLTGWARANRYAGSGDRAAIRDLVFDVLRQKRSCAAAGGAPDGRGLVLGLCRLSGRPVADLFTGQGYAPAPLTDAETAHSQDIATLPKGVRLDFPDWLQPELIASLGGQLDPVMHMMQSRAKVFLRVNPRKATRAEAIAALAKDQITAQPHPLALQALEVTNNPRKVAASVAYQSGLVELQDAASQAVIDLVEVSKGDKVLDYCAGGGGKVLAMAACHDARFYAHDQNPGRMRDLPARADRAGVRIEVLTGSNVKSEAPFDLIFCDVPCSGSGAWRRVPAGKWELTAERLQDLHRIQAEILDQAARLVRPGGRLAYATCSVLKSENDQQIDVFLSRNPAYKLEIKRQFLPMDGGDGMFLAVLKSIT